MKTMQPDIGLLLQRTNDLLETLVRLQLRPIIESELSDTKKKKLYELTGGSLPIKQISERVGLATGTISQTWQRWEDAGLLIKNGKSYRKVLS
jgi:Predicted transcriptional regulator